MNEALKIGMEAINRWIYHGWNYDMTEVDVPDYCNGGLKRVCIPRFLAEAKWTCNLPHMIEKWSNACSSKHPDAYLVAFYANLDSDNRLILLEWVLKNYTGESKLFK